MERRMNLSFDFNMVAVGQKKLSTFPDVTSIDIISEVTEQLRYYNIWSFMTQTDGIWYNVGLNQDGLFSALPLLNAEFDSDVQTYPYWIDENEDIKSNLVPLMIKPEYREDFKKTIETLIKESPHRTIYLMARMQGGEKEVVCGVLSPDDFWKLHDNKKIFFNACYIING